MHVVFNFHALNAFKMFPMNFLIQQKSKVASFVGTNIRRNQLDIVYRQLLKKFNILTAVEKN